MAGAPVRFLAMRARRRSRASAPTASGCPSWSATYARRRPSGESAKDDRSDVRGVVISATRSSGTSAGRPQEPGARRRGQCEASTAVEMPSTRSRRRLDARRAARRRLSGVVGGVLDLDTGIGDVVEAPAGIGFQAPAQHPANAEPARPTAGGCQSGSRCDDGRQRLGRVARPNAGAPSTSRTARSRRPRCRCAIHARAARLFGAHVAWCSGNDASRLAALGNGWRHTIVAQSGRDRIREAEVEHLHGPGRGELDVGRLEIAMDDAFLVRSLERIGNLAARSRAPRRAPTVRRRDDRPASALRRAP